MKETNEPQTIPAGLQERLLAALEQTASLCKPAELRRLIGKPSAQPRQIQAALTRLMDQGRAFGYATAPTRPPTLFSVRDFTPLVGDAIVARLTEQPLLAEKDLIAAVRTAFPQSLATAFFKATIERLVADGRLFEHPPARGRNKLYALHAYEPLEQRLLRLLDNQRRLEKSAYPAPLDALLMMANTSPDDPQVKRLLRPGSEFSRRAVRAAKHPSAPVLFREDIGALTDFGPLVEFALEIARKGRNRAFTLKSLSGKLDTALRARFLEQVACAMLDETLPASIAWTPSATPLLFRIEDLHPVRLRLLLKPSVAAVVPTDKKAAHGPVMAAAVSGNASAVGANALVMPPPTLSFASFAAEFDAVFAALDQRAGARNFVSLTDLRAATAHYPREQFDAGFRELRRLGRYSVNAAQGRFGITDADRDAAIVEEGVVLLHVSRERA